MACIVVDNSQRLECKHTRQSRSMPQPRSSFSLSDFDYSTAVGADRTGARDRAHARAACCTSTGSAFADLAFADLPRLIARGDLIVFNDTRVDQGARSQATQADRRQGRAAARARARPERGALPAPREPSAAGRRRARCLPGGARATVVARARSLLRAAPAGRRVVPRLSRASRRGAAAAVHRARAADADDEARYQTVYRARARRGRGADRRPALRRARCSPRSRPRGVAVAHVTLHVGAGTFQPVATRGSRRAHDARRVVPDSRGDRRRHRGRRARAAAASSPSARRAVRALESAADADGRRAAQARARRGSSSRRAIASASSTACSPISTCRSRRC